MKYYPEHSLEKFEFDSIRNLIFEQCVTYSGKQISFQLRPYSTYETISNHLALTKEVIEMLQQGADIPIESSESTQQFLTYLSKEGATGSVEQFLVIRSIVRAVFQLNRFIKHKEEVEELNIEKLKSLIYSVEYDPSILKELDSIFSNNGTIKNSASSVLAVIREEKEKARKELEKQFRNALRKYQHLNYLADVQESVRHGRRVLAVKSEYKRKIPGVIHDISETGQTTYIEPNESLQYANEYTNLEQEERVEIHRILRELTKQIQEKLPLISNYDLLIGRVDFTRAKAKFGIKLNAVVPSFRKQPIVKLVRAYHPILKLQNQKLQKSTSPLDLELNAENRIIVISGPNAGGKSVALKTLGLLQIMIQSGLPIPVAESSELGMFSQLLSEIGDEQSIENELSTYSSKLAHMTYFLKHADSKTLFLIDEFGSGTDPSLGGSIAQSILEELNEKKSFGIVTTHYLNLKVYAQNTDGVLNGAMLFDEESFKPLYQLNIGQPGSSYTFAIAQTSGLPKPVINRAKEISSLKQVELDELLNTTQKEQSDLVLQQLELDQQKRELNKQQAELSKIQKQLNEQKTKYKISKKDEELRIKTEVKKEFDEYVKQLNQIENKQQGIQHIRENLKNNMDTTKSMLQENKRDLVEANPNSKQKEIEVGDQVEWISTGQTGEVLDIKNNKAEVLLGNLKTTITLQDLVPTKKTIQKKAKTRLINQAASKPVPKQFTFELDIRGKRYNEAREELMQFFDQAILANANWVRILHGKGSGALKRLTEETAKQFHAKQIKHPAYEDGGDGVSIIEF